MPRKKLTAVEILTIFYLSNNNLQLPALNILGNVYEICNEDSLSYWGFSGLLLPKKTDSFQDFRWVRDISREVKKGVLYAEKN